MKAKISKVLILWGLTLACAGLAALGAWAADRPNILFILTDDLGYSDLGCYGATHVKTPNLDRLAREGLRFTDAHAPSRSFRSRR